MANAEAQREMERKCSKYFIWFQNFFMVLTYIGMLAMFSLGKHKMSRDTTLGGKKSLQTLFNSLVAGQEYTLSPMRRKVTLLSGVC